MNWKTNNRAKNQYTSSPMFKLTKEQSDSLKMSIRESFRFMQCGNFGQKQWLDVLTRIMVGKLMIKQFYTEETVQEFEPCVKACVSIEERAALTDHRTWDMTEDEEETLLAGLDAVDITQDTCTRRDFLLAHKNADKEICKMYIKKRESLEATL